MAFVTDNKDKGKAAVYVFVTKIAELLKDKDIGTFIMYTDPLVSLKIDIP